MNNPIKMQAIIDKLQRENDRLRMENARLRKAEAGERLEGFAKEKERAILFAIKAIEDRTMAMVKEKLAPTFNLHSDSLVIRAFQDCLRLSMHFVDPKRMTDLYNALKLSNPNSDGKVPSIDEVEDLLKSESSQC